MQHYNNCEIFNYLKVGNNVDWFVLLSYFSHTSRDLAGDSSLRLALPLTNNFGVEYSAE